MSNLVNTNVGAAVALQYLNHTNRLLDQTQARVNSGLRVSSTREDSAVYNLAQGLRGDEIGLDAITSSLNTAKSVVDTAINATEAISDLFNQMRSAALKAEDPGASADYRTQYQNDYLKFQEDVKSLIKTASFNNINILQTSGGGSVSALRSLYGGSALGSGSGIPAGIWAPDTVTVDNQKLDDATAGFNSIKTTSKIDTQAGAKQAIIDLAKDKVILDKTLTALGAASRGIDRSLQFNSKLTDTLHSGIGNLVDADLAKESANLQALQVKQQLGTQALSIANQAPQALLQLFRG
ncbi:flagellin N-terminal helical domain-containing protein [Sphingomonas sp. RIT328]|uniref:flagellin N-terminal helical domain-containing protein n=1 Tax=Sphingomonas sp. RIT328 TaxID=1470591 RepID=UPI0004488F79|nr:flagellin [Sphingomonas sp. RIT328]EZP48671.1 Flagellin domain-containing protein [Sphingomonas sp. RIT328]